MDLPQHFNESILARGWRDAGKAMHTLTFALAETFGSIVSGIVFQSVWAGLIFFLAFMGAVWLVATVFAPFVQRNEARNALADLRRSQEDDLVARDPDLDQWAITEDAAQILYDGLTSKPIDASGKMTQAMKALSDDGDVWERVGHWMADGINRGILIAEGYRESRRTPERMAPGINARRDFASLRSDEGMDWVLWRVDRKSITSYLKDLADDQLARSPEEA